MTAIRPTDSALRDKIAADEYNEILNNTNAKYTEMDKYITNLESDILSIKRHLQNINEAVNRLNKDEKKDFKKQKKEMGYNNYFDQSSY